MRAWKMGLKEVIMKRVQNKIRKVTSLVLLLQLVFRIPWDRLAIGKIWPLHIVHSITTKVSLNNSFWYHVKCPKDIMIFMTSALEDGVRILVQIELSLKPETISATQPFFTCLWLVTMSSGYLTADDSQIEQSHAKISFDGLSFEASKSDQQIDKRKSPFQVILNLYSNFPTSKPKKHQDVHIDKLKLKYNFYFGWLRS